jgi:transcriptional regulator with XRE-family HTH domain
VGSVVVMGRMLGAAASAVKARSILVPSGPPKRGHAGADWTDGPAPGPRLMAAPRSELAEFLRARREQTRPRDVGLPDSGRRRTPGLRREEVATLAGVSVDYLVRLEQGRDVHPSAEVLAALADAMRLSAEERLHLGKLALIGANGAMCPAARDLVAEVAPTVLALLDRLDTTPAFVLGPASDVLAWNLAWAMVAGPLGMLDVAPGAPRPNLARYVFTHPQARQVEAAWRVAADEQVGQLRRASVFWGHDDGFAALVDELRAEPEFETRWSAHPVGEKRRGTKVLSHPVAGDLLVAFEVLGLADDSDQRLVTWLPGDDASADHLRRLVTDGPAGPVRLRVVGEP